MERLLNKIDPEGCSYKRAKHLRRRNYVSMGLNYCWYKDEYDKLKLPYSFPIHGCIDGFSRKILWLKVTRSNNDPAVISQFYQTHTYIMKLGQKQVLISHNESLLQTDRLLKLITSSRLLSSTPQL